MSEQLRADHFLFSFNGNLPGIRTRRSLLSSLNGILPGQDIENSVFGGTHVFSTNPRGVTGRLHQNNWDPSNLVMESVQWDKSTYVLPTVLPPTAAPELPSRVLALTLKTLKSSTRGDYATKAALLEQRFQCASAATRVRTTASSAKNILGGAYTFEDPLVKRNTGAVINLNDPPTVNDRRNSEFLEFRVTFSALTLDPSLNANPQSFVTAVRLPCDEVDDMVIEELETRADFFNATRVMAEVLRTAVALPELLSLDELTNRRLQITEKEMPDNMMALYDQVYFELLQQEIGKDYAGDAIQNAQLVVQNTLQIKFIGGRQVCDPIEVFLKRFASAIDLLDEDKPYLIDIVSTYHQNMAEMTRKQIKTLGWVEPLRTASNAGQHDQLSPLLKYVQ